MKRAPRSIPLALSVLTPIALRQLADPRSYVRGEEYFADGRVQALSEHAGKIAATVHGSEPYSVELWQKGEELAYDCSCPRGEDGDFCKHCVAVGLALLTGPSVKSAGTRSQPRHITLEDARRHLDGETKAVLVDLLVDRAAQDADLFNLLRLRVAKQSHRGSVDMEEWKAVLRRTIDPGDFLDWRAVSHHAMRIDRVLDSLEQLITDGNASAAIELADYALQEVEQAIGSVDDSGGDMGGLLRRLEAIHQRACQQAKPDGIALAKRLFDWELRSGFDVFFDAVTSYADVLGKKGVAEYRRLAEEHWQKIPALGPGQSDRDQYGGRFRITSIMQALAKQAGDIDAEAQVMQRDLSSAYRFLEIATHYGQAGKHDQALQWAEKGIEAFPTRTDGRLREFLADEYHRRDRHDGAMALAWASFSEQPSLQEYEQLKAHAERAKSRPMWREKALDFIRERIAKNRKTTPTSPYGPTVDHSLLVEVYLSEKDTEAAWQEAQVGGCSSALWLTLAERREKAHPEDALPIYKRHLDSTLAQTNNAAYETGVRLLKKIHGAMSRMGEQQTFAPYLASVRMTYARKRNFVRLLEETRWS
jgi:uncharacterized Zn finger protein